MSRKNAGGKNEGIFHYVIENKWWKNVRDRPFHYVDENKRCYKRLSIMLMKKRWLFKKHSPVTARCEHERLSGFPHPDTRREGHTINREREVQPSSNNR